jgi:hypothetical protein
MPFNQESFDRDLERGQKAEKIVLDLLNECGLKTTLVDSNGPNRDFWDLESQFPMNRNFDIYCFTIEVKNDIYEQKSNNIAIEVGNSELNKPSGLEKTKADLWAHVLCDSIWITTTKKLRSYVESQEPVKELKNAGDKNAHIRIYPSYQILPEVFYRLDKLETYEQFALVQRLVYESRCKSGNLLFGPRIR